MRGYLERNRSALWGLILLAMLAFAANSLLCRFALRNTVIDPMTFTLLRLMSGAWVLWLLVRYKRSTARRTPIYQWKSALSLCVYALAFSFAYVQLDAGVGALLLFGAVQVSLLVVALKKGEHLSKLGILGFISAIIGVLFLLLPSSNGNAPVLDAALLMLLSGVAWATYTVQGKSVVSGDVLAVTAGNFMLAVPLSLVISLAINTQLIWDTSGVICALASGGLASGLGYSLWYQLLPRLTTLQAASVQLSVPILASLLGVMLLQEAVTLRLLFASTAVLGGIALVLNQRQANQ